MSRQPAVSAATMVLAAAFPVLFIGGGARFAIGLTLKSVVEDFGWGRRDLGAAVALFQVVSAVCMYLAGRLADRMSPRLVLSGGLLIAGVGIGLMMAMAAPWHALLLFGVVFAVGNGAASLIPVGVMVTRAFPRRTGLANAVVTSGMSIGQLVVIFALAIVLVAIGWPSVFLWLGIAHVVAVPLLLLAMPASPRGGADGQAAAPEGLDIRQAARTRPFWLLLGVYALCGLDDFFVSTHVVAVPEHAPDQATNTEPSSATAVSVTLVRRTGGARRIPASEHCQVACPCVRRSARSGGGRASCGRGGGGSGRRSSSHSDARPCPW